MAAEFPFNIGDGTYVPSEKPTPLIDPDDPCQSWLCTRIDGRCVGWHCATCGEPTGSQGHRCPDLYAEENPHE